MKINWFPGHMSKTLKMMQEEVKNVDAIIYVLDARAPFSCLNPSFIRVIGDKPVIYVLNKIDLIDKSYLAPWVDYLSDNNRYVINMNSSVSGAGKVIVECLTKALKGKTDYYLNKGAKITLRAMIIGVPNSGKSTLANNLCGKSKAVTGNKPGVTKTKQWVKLSDYVEVLDTPGTLWPSLTNQNTALNLALIGSIKEEVLDINELALELVKKVIQKQPDIIKERYKVEPSEDGLETLENIALARGFKLKGGDIDYDRICMMLVSDYKKGKLGTFILDNVPSKKIDE